LSFDILSFDILSFDISDLDKIMYAHTQYHISRCDFNLRREKQMPK
jgi:hypothetical protein